MLFAARHYKPDADYVAMRSFQYLDLNFNVGDVFDWRAIGLTNDQVKLLWNACLLNVAAEIKKPVTEQLNAKRKR